MNRKLTENEMALVELVHFLAYGSPQEIGLTLKETFRWLEQPISSKQGLNALECLEKDKRKLLKEVKTYLDGKHGR